MSTLTAVTLSLLLAASSVQADDTLLPRLAWLAGCWTSDGAEPGSGEHWMPLAGGTLLGVSRTVRQGRTVAHEFMQIRHNAEGKLVFIAQPSGQRQAEFPLRSLSDTEAVFENVQHDFPQRVVYRRELPDKLKARIEGVRNGSQRVIDFPLTRAACDGPARQ